MRALLPEHDVNYSVLAPRGEIIDPVNNLFLIRVSIICLIP